MDTIASATRATARRYFPHVEGIRGLAAFYVFLFHLVYQKAGLLASPLAWIGPWAGILQGGHYAVSIFIVVSGYCLGFPVARLQGTFDAKAFAKRRFLRLYPAYLVALVFVVPVFYLEAATAYHHRPPFSHVAVALVSHLLLVHNLNRNTLLYLSAPMWSIALEVQIYVVFALALIPVWKRYGANAQLALAAVLSLAPYFLAHGVLDWTCPWLLWLFAMGVWAADQTARSPHAKVPWTWLALAATVAGFALASTHNHYELTDPRSVEFLIPDVVLGAAVSLIFVASAAQPGWFVARLLGARPFQILGSFSYSLYLIHAPAVALIWSVLVLAHASAVVWAVTWVFAIPLVLVAARGLYLFAERPFLSTSMRSKLDDVVEERRPVVEALAGT